MALHQLHPSPEDIGRDRVAMVLRRLVLFPADTDLVPVVDMARGSVVIAVVQFPVAMVLARGLTVRLRVVMDQVMDQVEVMGLVLAGMVLLQEDMVPPLEGMVQPLVIIVLDREATVMAQAQEVMVPARTVMDPVRKVLTTMDPMIVKEVSIR